MPFRLVPGIRHLSLPWLWIAEGSFDEPCQVAVGTGTHQGLAAIAPSGGEGRGYVVRGTLGGGLGGMADLGGGPSGASIAGLYNGAPVVTDGSRFLFRSARWGWVVSPRLAEPEEYTERTSAYAVVDGVPQCVSDETETLGSAFWAGSLPESLGEAAVFSPRGSLKDAGDSILVVIDADLARRRRTSPFAVPKGISGDYEGFSGDTPPGVGSIGPFAATGDVDYAYQAARLL